MDLNDTQRDAFAELLNLGFCRAAASLSQITDRPIKVEAPLLEITRIGDIPTALRPCFAGDVACVDQPFHGPIAGHALLVMDAIAARDLAKIVGAAEGDVFDAVALEVIGEVGNIILNACLSIFERHLGVAVTFAVPITTICPLADVFAQTGHRVPANSDAILVRTRLGIQNCSVQGCVMVVPHDTAVDRVLRELAAWQCREN